MKPIQERANEYERNLDLYGFVNKWPKEAFVDGAESEHEELTRWNSPECPPDGPYEVLAKICGGYYQVVTFDSNYKMFKVSGTRQHIEIFGWREIHE